MAVIAPPLDTPLVSCHNHNAFAFYLDSTNLGIGALLRSSFVTRVMC